MKELNFTRRHMECLFGIAKKIVSFADEVYVSIDGEEFFCYKSRFGNNGVTCTRHELISYKDSCSDKALAIFELRDDDALVGITITALVAKRLDMEGAELPNVPYVYLQ